MPITPIDPVQIEALFNDEFRLNQELIDNLVPAEQHEAFSRQATQVQAFDKKVSFEQMDEWLNGPPREPHQSIHGGEHAAIIADMCLNWINTYLPVYKVYLYEAICVKFAYCEKRKTKQTEAEGVNLAIRIADSLVGSQTHIPLPLAAISVYIVKKHILDQWCNCDSKLP